MTQSDKGHKMRPKLDCANLKLLQRQIITRSHIRNCQSPTTKGYLTFGKCKCSTTASFRIKYLFENAKLLKIYNKTTDDPFHCPFLLARLDPLPVETDLASTGDELYKCKNRSFITAFNDSAIKEKPTNDTKTKQIVETERDKGRTEATTFPNLSSLLNMNTNCLNIKQRDMNGVSMEFQSDDSDLLIVKNDDISKRKKLDSMKLRGLKMANFKCLKFPNLSKLDKNFSSER